MQVIHTVHEEFHWPPISRGTCDNLFCRNPPCIARVKEWKVACVHVFQIVHGYWKYIGYLPRRYWDHKECSCKTCNDIRRENVCTATRPCPNGLVRNSFCYWNNRECDCCTPFKCPPGQVFNHSTCECDCPPGSWKNRQGHCVGEYVKAGLLLYRDNY